MNNYMNTIEMKGIAKMPYYIGGNLDFYKIAPIPCKLMREQEEDDFPSELFGSPNKKLAMLAALTEGLTIPVKNLNVEKIEMLRECAVACFASDISWFIISNYRQNPRHKAWIPVIEHCVEYGGITDPVSIVWLIGWLRTASNADVDAICIKWAEELECNLRKKIKTGELSKRELGAMQDEGVKYMYNYDVFGAMDTVQWKMKYWGTVNFPFDTVIHGDNKISFFTYGNAPIPIMKTISANNAERLVGRFCDENGTEGTYIIENGEMVAFETHPFKFE